MMLYNKCSRYYQIEMTWQIIVVIYNSNYYNYYNILTSLMSQLRYILHSLLKVYINELDVYEATINKVVFKVLIKVYII